jgi:hypothetical protein
MRVGDLLLWMNGSDESDDVWEKVCGKWVDNASSALACWAESRLRVVGRGGTLHEPSSEKH